MTWRYQPVWVGDEGEQAVTICEIYLDSEGKLKSWTADPQIAPLGEDRAELIGDLRKMFYCARVWKPVQFSELKPGMTFERIGARS